MMTVHWHWTRRRFIGTLLAVTLLVTGGLPADPAAAQRTGPTIRLLIDYGDGTIKIITDLPWAKGNTVLDVLNNAQTHSHGISFTYTGSGASAQLTAIDDVQNQGGGTGHKNWQFWVNSAYADRSFAAFEVQPLDVVFWRFTTEQGK